MSGEYVIHTDGASRKDGRGGWGATILHRGKRRDLWGGAYNTTNNRMELRGAIEALADLPEGSNVVMNLDSQYVINGITEDLKMWKMRGWRTSTNKPVKNQDLWRWLEREVARHASIEWVWVRGHNGDEGNEHADYLAGFGVPEK